MTHDIAILIPAYNEEKTILNVITPLLAYSPHIIVVDDGSTDNTVRILAALDVTILKHPVNQGKGACLQTGFNYLRGWPLKGVITLDGDGQHNPEDLVPILSVMQDNPTHLIIGSRLDKQKNAPKYRYYANIIADFFISNLMHTPLHDSQSGFRFYPQSFINQNLDSRYKRFGYESWLLFFAKQHNIHITHVNIMAIYPEGRRNSYFKPSYDSMIILSIIFVELLRATFKPYHSLKRAVFNITNHRSRDND